VRRIGGDTKPLVRLIGLRLRAVNLPPNAEILPWPKARGVGRPRLSRAAEALPPTDRPAIVTKATKAKIERDRVRTHRRAQQDPENQAVEPVRRQSGSASPATWRDPDDTGRAALMRGHSKEVRGFRNVTSIDYLVRSGTLTRAHGRAANLFRNQVEKSAGLGLGQADLSAPKVTSGTTPVGISEMQLFALDGVRQVKKLLNGLYPLVLAIAVEDITIKAFAARTRISPSMCAGRLAGGLEVLAGHYSPPEPKEAERHTIGAQLGERT
jgi:hypothetical protein